MAYGLTEVHIGGDTVLLGRSRLFVDLPSALKINRGLDVVLRRSLASHDATRTIRTFVATEKLTDSIATLSDQEVLATLEAKLASGQIEALLLRQTRARGALPTKRAKIAPTTPRAPARTANPFAMGHPQVASSGAGAPPTTPAAQRIPPGFPAAQPGGGTARPVAQWSTEERLSFVIRGAASRVPGELEQGLLELLSPQSLALMAGFIVVGVAANMTPYGWVADAVIAGAAFVFGGIAAIHALKDLAECFAEISTAKSERDLDKAGDALARAVVAIGLTGLMAILHRIAARRAGRGGVKGAESEETLPRNSERRPDVQRSSGANSFAEKPEKPSPSPAREEKPKPKEATKSVKSPRTNEEIRQWYNDEVGKIPELNAKWKEQGLGAEERARRAYEIRHNARLQARAFMENPDEVAALRARDKAKYGNPDGPSFEQLVEDNKKSGLSGDEIYESMIDSSRRTSKEYNEKFGIKPRSP
ncbi:hypothetical protein [Siculibacillus lacustris]|uniref:hypothetical protein n=1 Tax=Siculibacillus lacustris TaxID=1549641 RepID=UPI0019CFFCC4|nr:hypothetical protein [Siculibacillus lacustris]